MIQRHRTFPACLLGIALISLASFARAQEAGPPDIRVGDQWHFAVYDSVPSQVPNRVWMVKSVTPTAIEATENGLPLLLTPELNLVESPRQAESNHRMLSFPLQVGKRWRYESHWTFKPKGSRGTVAVDVEVVGRERITVPAGEFDTFKLFARGNLGGTSPTNTFYGGETTTTYWYAPAARAIVKSRHHSPYLGATNIDLVAVRRAP